MENIEIRKVLERKDGIKMVIIPKKSNINKDDYVKKMRETYRMITSHRVYVSNISPSNDYPNISIKLILIHYF